jgi:hypothetical protein
MKAVQCAAITRGGCRCASAVLPESQYCWTHDPAAADRRREASRKGGKARANSERVKKLLPAAMAPEEIGGRLSQVYVDVIEGRVSPKIGTCAATIARALLEVREVGELERRLEELEARAGVTDTKWRA